MSELSLCPPDTPRMGVEGELGPAGADGDELMKPPNIDLDDGRWERQPVSAHPRGTVA
jgi:hypothetical protein